MKVPLGNLLGECAVEEERRDEIALLPVCESWGSGVKRI